MRWLAILFVAACSGDETPTPSLDGPVQCDTMSCGSGQVCVLYTAGSQCAVNEDAGVPPYGVISATCVELPESCDGVPSCDCVGGYGSGMCFGVSSDYRTVTTGCI